MSSLDVKKDLPLPETSSKNNLANEFNSFLVDKVLKIRNKLMKNPEQLHPHDKDL